jgi:hypothetical protein
LVVFSHPSEKWWSSSVGIMTFPIYWKIKFMFQTTNQLFVFQQLYKNPGFRRCFESDLGGFRCGWIKQALWMILTWCREHNINSHTRFP